MEKIIFWSITVGLGGFLFGFDTAVISGAELAIQKQWNLDDWTHGLAVAIALYGTVFGAGFGGVPADKYGRKKTLFWIAILFLISAIGSAIAESVNGFMIYRFLGGLAIGASSVVAPIYISEIAPPEKRGSLVIAFQFNIVLGILMAYVSNTYISNIGLQNEELEWRWMIGVMAIPSILFAILVMFTPETPRWLLLHKGNEKEARRILGFTTKEVDKLVKEIKDSVDEGKQKLKDNLFSKKYSFPIILAFLLAFFNQLSGINAVIYYAPRIFESTGLDHSSSLFSSMGIGVFNLLFTVIGWTLIDRFGRKTLMYIGSIGYIISLALLAMSFYDKSYENVPIYIFVFIASHAIGQGSVIWVFISEIFPNIVRSYGMSFGCLIHWVFAAIITNVFPVFEKSFGEGQIFSFFSIMMVLQLLWVRFMMPETKGVSLEELQHKLLK